MSDTDTLGRLRHMHVDDLACVRSWRNHPDIRAMMYTQHVISADEHRDWWEKKSRSEDDLLFIYTQGGVDRGVVTFSQVDREAGTAYWGLYRAPDVGRGFGLALGYAALMYIFEQEKLRLLYCDVLAHNTRAQSYYATCGFEPNTPLLDCITVQGREHEIHRLVMSASRWANTRAGLRAAVLERISRDS